MMKKTLLDYRCLAVMILFLCGCLPSSVRAASHALTAKKGNTPFSIFKNLWEEQGNTIDEFNLLTPISKPSLEEITPLLKKALKVKEDVSLSDTLCVGRILTTMLQARYGVKPNEKNDFLAIQYSTSTADFDNYLRLYPTSKFAAEAEARKVCFEENEKWLVAQEGGKREDYEAFAEYCAGQDPCAYDGCENISATNHRRAEAVTAWYTLCDRSNGSDFAIYNDFADYLEAYGSTGVFTKAANDSIDLNKDKFDWHVATTSHTLPAYQTYLADHPDGRYTWFAEDNVAQMTLWDNAVASDQYSDYCAYYHQFPDGLYATEAIEKVKTFETADWTATKKKNTLAAYEKFVAQYPNGYYASEAQNKITEIRLAPYLKEAPSFNSISHVGFYSHPGYSLICLGNIDKNNRMTISLKGPTGFSKTLAPGKYEWVRVRNGNYKILVQASKTENWWGNASFENKMYAGAWSTYTNTLFGVQKVTNKDEDALLKMREDIAVKAAEEEINTRKYILGIEN
ncbi:MAG: hypothetical protein J5637_04405 [Prevotella sp.]|nr:hypothetical protein [Prevotella sp.]